jgi:hypothetical protein
MPWFVLSGRNVGFRIGKWASDFEATVPVIKDVLYGLPSATSVPAGVTILTNPCFLNEVDIDMSAGINPIVALGVENIASLEEFIVRAQNVRTRFTVQSQQAGATSGPIDFVHNLISGATRLGTSVGTNTYHLPPYFLDFFVVAPPVGALGTPVKVWRLSAPFAFIRNLRWTQRPEDAAQLEITWFVPYVFFGDVGTSVPTLSSYDASAGVLIVREAVFDIASEEEDETDNVLDWIRSNLSGSLPTFLLRSITICGRFILSLYLRTWMRPTRRLDELCGSLMRSLRVDPQSLLASPLSTQAV